MRAWYKWHKRLGITLFLFLLFMAISGFFLNHTQTLGLSERYINHSLIDWLYNKKVTLPKQGVLLEQKTAPQWLVENDKHQLWLHDKLLYQLLDKEHLITAINDSEFSMIVSSHRLLLITETGEIIDELLAPASIVRAGLSQETLVIETVVGYWQSNEAFTNWQQADPIKQSTWQIDWHTLTKLSKEDQKQLQRLWLGNSISLERFLQDLHSGRLLGSFGVWLVDLFALLSIILSITGLRIWLKTKFRR
jgi:hypothetical protein